MQRHTQRGDFFLYHIFFREPGSANACTPWQAVSLERSETPLISLVFLARLSILCTLSKSDRVVIMWSPSGYAHVRPVCHDALPSLCLLIRTWQLVKAHGVTRNELKIHIICYITTVTVGPLTSHLINIQERWSKHALHCWWSKDGHISNVFLCTEKPALAVKQKLIFISSVRTLGAVKRTF